MPKNKYLRQLLRSTSSARTKSATTSSSDAAVPFRLPYALTSEDVVLKDYVSQLTPAPSPPSSPPSPSPLPAVEEILTKPKEKVKPKPKPNRIPVPKPSSDNPIAGLKLDSLKLNKPISVFSGSEDSAEQLSRKITTLLADSVDSSDAEETSDGKTSRNLLDIPWFRTSSHSSISLRRKEVSRERKQRWVFKSTQSNRFERLVNMCTQKLGTDITLQVFSRLGRETGIKEYNALIHKCIEEALKSEDEEVSIQKLMCAFQLMKTMSERGFQVGERTYGPFLVCVIDMGIGHHDFSFFYEYFKKEDPNSVPKLAYYEMLLWIRDDNDNKIQELCSNIVDNDNASEIRESYMVALCQYDREEEILLLLETFDITKASLDSIEIIFSSLGRLLLESCAKKFVVELKTEDIGALDKLSNFIYHYAISIPSLSVEDVVAKFESFHVELDVPPSPVPYDKLIRNCCESLKIHAALDIVDRVFQSGLILPISTFNSILNACQDSCEYNLVHRIYSMICRLNLKPNNETFRIMINLCVKMKDFDGAYSMLQDLERMNLMPSANIYNAIMGGFFRNKNFHRGLMVLKQMEAADVKPDSQTFSYIIGNCNCEDDIIKYHKELKDSGVQVTKHVFMALINAYASCGLFEKAKQVVLEKGVPVKSLNEIKSALVSALASNGQIPDALNLYEEMKQIEADLEPKAILSLIEYIQSKGEQSRLFQLLKELKDPDYWIDGCFRVISYCARHKDLSSVVNLYKQLKEKLSDNGSSTENIFDEVFCQIAEREPTDVQFGMDLLKAIKEDIGLLPSRRSLDFLLSACVSAKNLSCSFTVWKEYETAGLPYNVLSFVRMYQALLASGDQKTAKLMLEKIPNDDPHVRSIVKACQETYGSTQKAEKEEKKKKKKKKKSK